jgi:membrane protease YdiL (CAAX protease family)
VHALWVRLPILVQAVVSGLAVAATGTLPWALLVSANIKFRPPCRGPCRSCWYTCGSFGGMSGERAGHGPRRPRAARVLVPTAEELWGPALFAGVLRLASVLLLQGTIGRLIALPQQRDLDVSQYPTLTVLMWVLMSAAVAGVVEETSFRGYVQRPIERRHGPAIAILVTGSLFGLVHFTHPEVTLVLLPYYMAVAAVYGSLAHLTDSTLPGMVLHGGGDALSAFDLFTRGRSEWQLSAAPRPLVWETGRDAEFLANTVALLVVA